MVMRKRFITGESLDIQPPGVAADPIHPDIPARTLLDLCQVSTRVGRNSAISLLVKQSRSVLTARTTAGAAEQMSLLSPSARSACRSARPAPRTCAAVLPPKRGAAPMAAPDAPHAMSTAAPSASRRPNPLHATGLRRLEPAPAEALR